MQCCSPLQAEFGLIAASCVSALAGFESGSWDGANTQRCRDGAESDRTRIWWNLAVAFCYSSIYQNLLPLLNLDLTSL